MGAHLYSKRGGKAQPWLLVWLFSYRFFIAPTISIFAVWAVSSKWPHLIVSSNPPSPCTLSLRPGSFSFEDSGLPPRLYLLQNDSHSLSLQNTDPVMHFVIMISSQSSSSPLRRFLVQFRIFNLTRLFSSRCRTSGLDIIGCRGNVGRHPSPIPASARLTNFLRYQG